MSNPAIYPVESVMLHDKGASLADVLRAAADWLDANEHRPIENVVVKVDNHREPLHSVTVYWLVRPTS